METFDLEKWKDDYETLKYNQKCLGFDISLKVENGKARIKTNASAEIKKDLVSLLESILNQGNLFSISSLAFTDIEETDQEAYLESWIRYYTGHLEAFLQVLILQGIEPFMDLVFKTQTMHKLAYHLEHTWPEVNESSDITWKGSDGYTLDSDLFWTKDSDYGTLIRPDSYIAWDRLL